MTLRSTYQGGGLSAAQGAGEHDLLLGADGVSLSYPMPKGWFGTTLHPVFEGLTFAVRRGESLAVVGRNGAGKSTLLKVLAGIISPTSGDVWRAPGVTTSLLALGVGYNPFLTGRDNVVLSAILMGHSQRWVESRLEEIKAFSELGAAFERPVKTYSSGMRSRLAFSGAIFMEVDVLLIDEVLAVGDGHFRKKAKEALTSKITGEQTVVLVSHSTEELRALCDSAIWLEDYQLRQAGPVEEVVDAYEASL